MKVITTDLEEAVSAVSQYSFILEGAIHRPGEWTTLIDGVRFPVFVETTVDGDEVCALFVSGPVQAGERYVSLELNQRPVFGRVEIFTEGSCWVHTIIAKIDR